MVFVQFARQHVDGSRYHCSFNLNRLPLRREHFGADGCLGLSQDRLNPKVLTEANDSKTEVPNRVLFVNRKELNEQQKQAVRNIVNGSHGMAPFLVFGPPGTGKTTTLTACIRAVLSTQPNSRILCCAPSNSAADLFVSNLAELSHLDCLRVNAAMRPKQSVPIAVLPYCRYNSN